MIRRFAMEKILVVGAGITGAAVAAFLRDLCPQLQVVVWDKAQGIGGRMSTSRSPSDSRCTVDLGAQYISVTPEYKEKHAQLYKELLSEGLLHPLTTTIEGGVTIDGDTEHYVTPQGSSLLVKHFIKKSGAEVKCGHHVSRVDVTDGGKVQVWTTAGLTEQFDGILLTALASQILQLQGSIQSLLDSKKEERDRLSAVTYSSRFALGLFYKAGEELHVPWSAKYISGHPCIRFVSIDSKKRAADISQCGPSVVVHTSVPYGVQNLERDEDELRPEILQHFRNLFPQFPVPDHVKSHKWLFSQVTKSFCGSLGYLILQETPLIMCAGDSFTHSKFDGCIDSATAAVNAILEIKKKDLRTL